LPEPYRAAVYYTPERADPLWARGCTWLGRDPETGEILAQPAVPRIAALTSDPRRYGFHATLKPPMRLARGFSAFLRDVESFASGQTVFQLPPLEVRWLGRFIALGTAKPCPALDALAASCVATLDPHRLPEDEAARAKRAIGRTPSQLRNLERWGYPLVMEDWQFHMTLSNALNDAALLAPAIAFFGFVPDEQRAVASLAVFVQPVPDAPFSLAARLPFGA
jgi:hypothetical protein